MLKVNILFILMLQDCFASEELLNKGKSLFDIGSYEKAEVLFNQLSHKPSAETHYYLALINDLEFHSIKIQPGHPKYNKRKDKKAKHHYKSAIKLGHCYSRYYFYIYSTSMHPLRQFKTSSTRDRFRKKTINCLKKLAKNDDASALYMLGDLISVDVGKPASKVTPIVNQLNTLAQNGNIKAQYFLGRVYSSWYFRDEIFRDYKKAFSWFAIAAYNKHHKAQKYAEFLMSERINSQSDKTEAVNMAQKFISAYSSKK